MMETPMVADFKRGTRMTRDKPMNGRCDDGGRFGQDGPKTVAGAGGQLAAAACEIILPGCGARTRAAGGWCRFALVDAWAASQFRAVCA